MKKRLSIFLLAVALAAIASLVNPQKSLAAVSYTWEYSRTNFYNCETTEYEFSGLDASTEYQWDLYTVDPKTGNLQQSLGFQTETGSTTYSTRFGGCALDPFTTDSVFVPEGYVGPLAVVDSNGTILGRHFVAIDPSYTPYAGDWVNAGGNTAIYDKQVVGPTSYTGYCKNPAYADYNSDGWQHTFKPCSVITQEGSYAIMHYDIDPSYVGPTDLRFMFFLIPTTDVTMTVYVDDILAYQQTSGYAGSDTNFYNFIVINTGGPGSLLPFTDNVKASGDFTTGDNPLATYIAPGVYNYSRNDTSGWVSDGESVWIVSQDPNMQEWTLTGSSQIGADGKQLLTTHAVTQEVWDSYHGYQLVADSTAGYSDSTIYAFSTSRNFLYATVGFAANDIVAQWINRAVAMNTGLATPTEMEFEVQFYYDVLAGNPTIEQNANQVLHNIGMDTASGRAALLMIIEFAAMLGVAAFTGLKGNIYAYLVVWTGMGAVFILGGFSTGLVTAVFSVMTIGMWIFAMLSGGVVSENKDG